MSRKTRKWWKNHWDEVALVTGLLFAVLLILIGRGII